VNEGPVPEGRSRTPLAAVGLVAVFLAAVIVVVARLPGSAPAGSSGGTGTGTGRPLTGRAAIGVDVEVPVTSGPSSTTTTGSHTSTTTTLPPGSRPVVGAAVEPTLRAAGFDVVAVGTSASPPLTTQIRYTPHHLGDALTVRTILRLPMSSVSAYTGSSTDLPSGTDVLVLVGAQA
jgi:hypothetical protein